jgi:hypothetical protein
MVIKFTFEDVANHPAVIKMAEHYPSSIRKVMIEAFYSTFRQHMTQQFSDRVDIINLSTLESITWEDESRYFCVYFNNGDRYRYRITGEWF